MVSFLNRKLGGPQDQSVCSGEEKIPLSLLGFKPWIIQLVSYTLYYLNCPGSQKDSGSVAKTPYHPKIVGYITLVYKNNFIASKKLKIIIATKISPDSHQQNQLSKQM